MLEYQDVYESASKAQQKVLDTYTGNVYSPVALSLWVTSLKMTSLQLLRSLCECYEGIECRYIAELKTVVDNGFKIRAKNCIDFLKNNFDRHQNID